MAVLPFYMKRILWKLWGNIRWVGGVLLLSYAIPFVTWGLTERVLYERWLMVKESALWVYQA